MPYYIVLARAWHHIYYSCFHDSTSFLLHSNFLVKRKTKRLSKYETDDMNSSGESCTLGILILLIVVLVMTINSNSYICACVALRWVAYVCCILILIKI